MNPTEIAAEFQPELSQRSAEIEAARQLPQELCERMASAGLYRLLVPEIYSGIQAHPWDFFETLAIAARGDASAGWNLMIGNTTGLLSASLTEAWAEKIYGANPDVITVGVTAPIGRAEVVDGGLNVTGRWPFGSGSQSAEWICGGCLRYENGEPVNNGQGQPEPLLVFFPAEEVTIHDTWDTSGLRGTGSHDIEVANQFVPQDRWVVLGKRARVDAPLYRFPTFGLLALGVSAVSIGIAQRALDEFIALAATKKPTGANRELAQRASAQKEVAIARAAIDSARAMTRQYIDSAYAKAESGEKLDLDDKAQLRLAAANNAWSAVKAVDLLYHAAGGSSIYRKNRLQQCFRDVHVTTQHIMVGQAIFEVVGKVTMGVDPKQPL